MIIFTLSGFLQAAFTNAKSSFFLEDKINFAFWFDNSKANAFPIPEEAPVIQTILSEKNITYNLTLQYNSF